MNIIQILTEILKNLQAHCNMINTYVCENAYTTWRLKYLRQNRYLIGTGVIYLDLTWLPNNTLTSFNLNLMIWCISFGNKPGQSIPYNTAVHPRVFAVRVKTLWILCLPKWCPAKTQIRLRRSAGWSESSLGAQAVLNEMLHPSSKGIFG